MPNTTKQKKKTKKKPEARSLKLAAFNIEDIELIKLTIKGKDYLLVPKPGSLGDAEINKQLGIRLLLDEHQVMDPSIQELEKTLKEVME